MCHADLADLLGALVEIVALHDLDGLERSHARHRVAAIGRAQPAQVRRIDDRGLARHRGQRHPRRDRLGHDDQVRLHAAMLDGEPAPRAAEAGLHLVGDQHDAVLVAQRAHLAQIVVRRGDEAALALHRLDDQRGHRRRVDLRDQRSLQVLEAGKIARSLVAAVDAAIAVRIRHAVDLRRKGTKTLLEERVLARQRKGQQRAAVIGALVGDDSRPSRVGARHLDGRLYRLGT